MNSIDFYDLERDEDMLLFNGAPYSGAAHALREDGSKKKELTFLDGFEHGHCVEWYPNGQRMCEWTAFHGQYDGECVTWHECGKVKSNWNLRSGRSD